MNLFKFEPTITRLVNTLDFVLDQLNDLYTDIRKLIINMYIYNIHIHHYFKKNYHNIE